MLFIFIQSALPGDLSGRESGMIAGFLAKLFHIEREVISSFVRKGAHFTEFALLGITLFLYVKEYFLERSRREAGDMRPEGNAGIRYVAAWIAGTFYACTDEFHQMFVAGRSGEIKDVLIDSAGVLAGIILTGLVLWVKGKRAGRTC